MFGKFRHIILSGLEAQCRAVEMSQQLMEGAFQGLGFGRECIGQLLYRVKDYECQTAGILKEVNHAILQRADRKLQDKILRIDRQLKNVDRCFKSS